MHARVHQPSRLCMARSCQPARGRCRWPALLTMLTASAVLHPLCAAQATPPVAWWRWQSCRCQPASRRSTRPGPSSSPWRWLSLSRSVASRSPVPGVLQWFPEWGVEFGLACMERTHACRLSPALHTPGGWLPDQWSSSPCVTHCRAARAGGRRHASGGTAAVRRLSVQQAGL